MDDDTEYETKWCRNRITDAAARDDTTLFRARLPDRGSGETRAHAYVIGVTPDQARVALGVTDRFSVYRTDEAVLTECQRVPPDGVTELLTAATGGNEIVLMDGTVIGPCHTGDATGLTVRAAPDDRTDRTP